MDDNPSTDCMTAKSDLRLSIVTPCFNRADFVADAIESVRSQGIASIEHIVIDGRSTDGTLDVLARYPEVIVVSEPDKGLYDALNKGLRMARGSIIGHLNTDDIYPPGAFAAVLDAFDRNHDIDMVCGGAEVAVRDGASWRPEKFYDGPSHCSLDWDLVMKGPILTNARFYRRDVFDRVGLFDDRYRIISDRDFLLRCALAGIRGVPISQTVYQYREHEGSLTFDPEKRNILAGFDEKIVIASDHLNRLPLDPDLRRRYRHWRRYERANAILAAMHVGRYGHALRHVMNGCAEPAAWLAYLLYRLGHAAVGTLHGRLRA